MDIFAKIMGYIFGKTLGRIGQKLWDILGQDYKLKYGIYLAKIMGYIWKNNGIY